MERLKEFKSKINKEAIRFQVGGFRPENSITSSWLGKVTVSKIDEEWPESNGNPMIPVCQINLKNLSNKPRNLLDIEFLTLFIDSEEIPDNSPNGHGWLLRTYKDLTQLGKIESPNINFPIKSFQLKPELIEQDFPCWEDCPIEVPQEFDEEYHDLFPNQEGIKIGGWPTLIQSEIFWAAFNKHPAEPEFVFQIDSVEKANCFWGDNGVLYFGRGTKPESKKEWTFSWQCY